MRHAVFHIGVRTLRAASIVPLISRQRPNLASVSSHRSFSLWPSRTFGPTSTATVTSPPPGLEHAKCYDTTLQTTPGTLDILPDMNTAGFNWSSVNGTDCFHLGDMTAHGLGGWTPTGLYQHLIELISASTGLNPSLTILATAAFTLIPLYAIRKRYARPMDDMIASIKTPARVAAIHDAFSDDWGSATARKRAAAMSREIVAGLRQQLVTHPRSVAIYAGACISEFALLLTSTTAVHGAACVFPQFGLAGIVIHPLEGAVAVPVLWICYMAAAQLDAGRVVLPYVLNPLLLLGGLFVYCPHPAVIFAWLVSMVLHMGSSRARVGRYKERRRGKDFEER